MRKILMVSIAVLFLVSAFAAQAMAAVIEIDTILERCITSDRTWSNADGYLVSGDVYVIDGAELTIPPGIDVKFAEGKGLIVGYRPATECFPFFPHTNSGTLTANGTSGSHITFTTTAADPDEDNAGDWGGIIFSEGSTGSTLTYADISYGGGVDYETAYGFTEADYTSLYVDGDDPSTISYIDVEYSASKGIALYNATGRIENSTVHNNSGSGILAAGNDSDTTIAECTIYNNTASLNRGIGIEVKTSDTVSIDGCNIYSNNQGVKIRSDNTAQIYMYGLVNDSVFIHDNTYLGIYLRGGTLTIDTQGATNVPAADIKGNGTYGIRLIDGTINLAGDAGAGIGIRDNDLNGGQNYGVYMSGGEVNSTYTNIDGNDIAGIYISNGELNTSTETRITRSNQFGVYLAGGEMTSTSTYVNGNDQLGILMTGGVLDMSYSTVTDNADNGGYSYGGNTYYSGIFVTGADGANNYADHCTISGNMHGTSGTYRKEFFNFALNGGSGVGDFDATYTDWDTASPEVYAIWDYDDNNFYGDVDSSNPQ